MPEMIEIRNISPARQEVPHRGAALPGKTIKVTAREAACLCRKVPGSRTWWDYVKPPAPKAPPKAEPKAENKSAPRPGSAAINGEKED